MRTSEVNRWVGASFGILCFLTLWCQPRTPSTSADETRAVLKVEEIACVFASTLTDARAIAEVCGIAPAVTPLLLPLLHDLIGQREGARKAGVLWRSISPRDGGLQDTGR